MDSATVRVLPLYDVPRRCACGAEWVGKSFTPIAEGEVLPRRGMCDACVTGDEDRQAELTRGPLTRRAPAPPPRPTAFASVRSEGEDWWDK